MLAEFGRNLFFALVIELIVIIIAWIAKDDKRTAALILAIGSLLAGLLAFFPQIYEGLFDPYRHWKVVYTERFDTARTSWPLGMEKTQHAIIQRSIVDGMYRMEVEPKSDVTAWPDGPIPARTNFVLIFDVRKLDGPRDGSCGISFRKQGPDRHILFRLSADARKFGVRAARGNNQWDNITASPWVENSVIQPNQTNQVKVIADDTHLLFFINGTKVWDTYMPQVESGMIDLAVQQPGSPLEKVTCAFDNIMLQEPPRT